MSAPLDVVKIAFFAEKRNRDFTKKDNFNNFKRFQESDADIQTKTASNAVFQRSTRLLIYAIVKINAFSLTVGAPPKFDDFFGDEFRR